MDTFDYDKEYKLQQELKSKDQQIKDLTELLNKADELIQTSSVDCFNVFERNEYDQLKQSYQQKYLTK